MSEWILEVSDLNEYVRASLNADPALRSLRLRGEISNFKRHSSGHWYFTLKDDRCRINAVMFRQNAMRMSIRPMDGMSVVVSGQVSLYAESGTYQIYCESMRPDGVGTLYQQFEALKAKLRAEGLFDQARKQPIPYRPRKIAVVTSRTGAVLHDIRKVSARRDPGVPLVLLPVQVQGQGAAEEIAAAIRHAGDLPGVDVIITGRGGGSMEDLWAFNDEGVARAIFASEIPVISAVGHEPDVTISDFVADLRAATPSNAAELAVPDREALEQNLDAMSAAMATALGRQLKAARQHLDVLSKSAALQSPVNYLQQRQKSLQMLQNRLVAAENQFISRNNQRYIALTAKLDAMSPLKVLTRGYAMAENEEGQLVRSIHLVQCGDSLNIRFGDGAVKTTVCDKKELNP